MRLLVVLFALLVAACNGAYGTYLVIDGNQAAIDFDQVELYFGAKLEIPGFGSPKFPSAGGRTFARQFVSSDGALVPSSPSSREATYYIPPGGHNDDLGDYVLAIASNNGAATGIGELVGGFEQVPTDYVDKYPIVLQPYVDSDVDRWGDAPGCVAWRHPRAQSAMIYAVTRELDRDCDTLPQAIDCDDRVYCVPGATDCNAAFAVCGDGPTCALGKCSNLADGTRSCQSTTCILGGVCDVTCDPKPNDHDTKLACGEMQAATHLVIGDPAPMGVPCNLDVQFALPNAVECTNAALEWQQASGDGYTFSVPTGTTGPLCAVRIILPTPPVPMGADDHFVISFDSPAPAVRWSILLSISPLNTPCTGGNPVVAPGEIADCVAP